MRGIVIIAVLICLSVFASHLGYSKSFQNDDFVNDRLLEQLECEVLELPAYLTLDNDTVYTIEIRLRNQSDTSKLLWFRNKEEITGKRYHKYQFHDALNFVAEYDAGTLRIAHVEKYMGVMFSIWCKCLAPQQEFTIFIQSQDKEKVKGAFKLIAALGYNTNNSIGVRDLDYEGDVVVISI